MPRQPKSSAPYREVVGLQSSIADRYARYLRETTDLVRRRSLDPKEWAANYSDLLCALIGDVGDFALRRAGDPLRPSSEWVGRFRKRIPRTQLTTSIPIEIPVQAFGSRKEVTLVTDGFSRGDLNVVLNPGSHVHIMVRQPPSASAKRSVRLPPGVVSSESRRAVRVRFSNLPLLQVGVYSGIICAKETDVTVAIVELEIF